MINGPLLRAGRARLARIRSNTDQAGDGGFALVFVLLVTTVITMAVAATLAVTAPNIHNARDDQDARAALAAAQAGVDDALAYLSGSCPGSTANCLPHARGENGTDQPVPLTGTGQKFSWHAVALDNGKTVRVTATGTTDSTTRKLVADMARTRNILSFGYYTDYESQSPSFLYDYFANRHVYLYDPSTLDQIDSVNASDPTTVQWYGPPTSGSNPYPASMCGQHWYAETGSVGRASYGGQSPAWGETGRINSTNVQRQSACDVVFTTGMTFDGPIYTRDALLISDQTNNGVGPIFKQPVLSLWGYKSGAVSYNSPAAPLAAPWRQDSSVGGDLSAASQKPTTATFDLRLPKDIGSEDLPTDNCVYTGPTRVKLNGDGTATVTSPHTTIRAAASDPACYPTGSLAGGVVNFTLAYKTAGHGAIYVKDALADGETIAPTTWPSTGTMSTNPATAQNSVFYLPATVGGTAAPDQPDSSAAADSSCSATLKYKSDASYPCAWTNVAATNDVGTGTGWSTYGSSTKCNTTIAASNRQLFECEYSHTTGNSTPSATNRYGALRTLVQGDLATGSCLTGTATAQKTCLTNLVNARLQTANTSGHAANYSSPASGDHQYVVTAATAGSTSQGTSQSVGSAPSTPMSGDSLFTSTSSAAQEAATKTPITLTVSRQTYGCVSGGSIVGAIIKLLSGLLGCLTGSPGWGGAAAQFSTTVTQSDWSIVSQASGASYFPDVKDVTQYNGPVSTAHGNDYPGDLYVDGPNSAQLSLLAQNDVIVTGDITDTSSDPKVAAVDVVAGDNVRNYHPVQCAEQTATRINNTSAGWCPNDITGLYAGASGMESNGTLTCAHPAVQYINMPVSGQTGSCSTSTNKVTCAASPTGRRIDAAIFALSGSFLTDNYNRGCALGPLTVNGGMYQSHRGANGVQWEAQASDTKRATSGYSLQYHYVDLENANLPYTPSTSGNGWKIASVSSAGQS